VDIQVNIDTCATYAEKFIRDNVVAPFVPTSIVIVTLSQQTDSSQFDIDPFLLTQSNQSIKSGNLWIQYNQDVQNLNLIDSEKNYLVGLWDRTRKLCAH